MCAVQLTVGAVVVVAGAGALFLWDLQSSYSSSFPWSSMDLTTKKTQRKRQRGRIDNEAVEAVHGTVLSTDVLKRTHGYSSSTR